MQKCLERCVKCGFVLNTKPNLYQKDNVCGACINAELAKSFDWEKRKQDFDNICKQLSNHNSNYDCVIAVSGGKDSTAITKVLTKDYNLNPLLVTVTDEFTHTQAGKHNIKNIAEQFNCDHIIWRCQPQEFKRNTLKDFVDELHPLKWIEEKIYKIPVFIAKSMGIKAVFFGENSDFEYGSSDVLNYLHPSSDVLLPGNRGRAENVDVYYFFAFFKYSALGSEKLARCYGFKDLNDFNEWQRQGNIENYTQIDSIAYIIQLWTKFVKFGFQRVSDMACRYVRQGLLSREQALQLIKDRDYICDPMAKRDFCNTLNISESFFDNVVDKHANKDLVKKDVNGIWRLREGG